MEERREQRQQRPGVEVAAGLVRRQLPRPQHLLLTDGRQPAADRPAEPRSVGDEVEREQHHREQLQQHAERGDRQLDRVALLVLDELLHGAVGVVEVLDDLLGFDVQPERVVEELDRVGDVALGVREQLGDLRPDERADGGEEDDERDEDAEQDRRGRRPAPPAAA